MNAKHIAALSAVLFMSTPNVFAEWVSLQQHSDILFGIDFESPEQGWVCGARDGIGPVIKNSDDSGATWGYQTQEMNNMFWMDVDMADTRYGWSSGLVALIGKWGIAGTTDGGTTWTPQMDKFRIAALLDIEAYDRNHAWAAGDWVAPIFQEKRGVMRTTDGGANWETQGWDLPEAPRFLDFVDANHGFVSCGHWPSEGDDAARFWRPTEQYPVTFEMPEEWAERGKSDEADYGCIVAATSNGGATWQQVFSSTDYYPNHIDFTSRTEGWMVVEGGAPRVTQILRTTNSGRSWTRQPHPLEGGEIGSITTVNMLNRREGWVVGWGSTRFGNPETRFLHTMDGGENWAVDPFTSNVGPIHTTFVDEGSGWTAGGNNNNISRVLGYSNPSRAPKATLEVTQAPETARGNATISYTVALKNLTNGVINSDGWVQITGPTLAGYESNVVIRRNLRIPGNHSRLHKVSLALPDLPNGTYAVESILGTAESENPLDINAYAQFSLLVGS